ncbi:MAG: hypothetical protein AB8B82_09890 [Roseovarius sp.]
MAIKPKVQMSFTVWLTCLAMEHATHARAIHEKYLNDWIQSSLWVNLIKYISQGTQFMNFKSLAAITFVTSISLSATAAMAGCKVNLTVENKAGHSIVVSSDSSKAKTKGGSWRRLYSGRWMDDGYYHTLRKGKKVTDVYNATYGCSKNRRFRIAYTCANSYSEVNNYRQVYYPGPSSWTKNQNVTIKLDC